MIRRATPDDAEAIARVHIRTWQGAYAHVFPPEALAGISAEARARAWRANLGGTFGATYVAERNGEVVGFASGGPSHDADCEGLGELYAIYVDPEHWDSGAGRQLAVQVEDALRGEGFAAATLWVLDDNPRARRFYESGGWRLDGATRTGTHLGVETHEVRYRKNLSETAGV
jgi:ribosomal protein S18 acetylase RimI-like enzyme